MHLCSIISWRSTDLCVFALSIMMTEFFCGKGFMLSSKALMKWLKSTDVCEYSCTSRCSIPSSERAGSMEYLYLTFSTTFRAAVMDLTFDLEQKSHVNEHEIQEETMPFDVSLLVGCRLIHPQKRADQGGIFLRFWFDRGYESRHCIQRLASQPSPLKKLKTFKSTGQS